MGFVVVFSGPIMAALIIMLVGTIIAFVFFILSLILAVAILSQLLFVTLIILFFGFTGGATALVGVGIYYLLQALGISASDVWAAVSPYVYFIFGVLPIMLLLLVGTFFGSI